MTGFFVTLCREKLNYRHTTVVDLYTSSGLYGKLSYNGEHTDITETRSREIHTLDRIKLNAVGTCRPTIEQSFSLLINKSWPVLRESFIPLKPIRNISFLLYK